MNLFDYIFIAFLCGAFISGFRIGFLRSIFSAVGFLAGGVIAIYLSLQYTDSWALDIKKLGAILVAIVMGGFLGQVIGRAFARSLRATIVRGPLRLLDSLGGAIVEVLRTTVIIYLIASLVLWAPWNSGRSYVSQSVLYAEVEAKLPNILKEINLRLSKSSALPELIS